MDDRQGRTYRKITGLRAGDEIELDPGFGCTRARFVTLEEDAGGLFFRCTADKHYLRGQTADNGEDLIGIYERVRV